MAFLEVIFKISSARKTPQKLLFSEEKVVVLVVGLNSNFQ